MPADAVDTQLLEDATRRGSRLCTQVSETSWLRSMLQRLSTKPNGEATSRIILLFTSDSDPPLRVCQIQRCIEGQTRVCYRDYSRLAGLAKLYIIENKNRIREMTGCRRGRYPRRRRMQKSGGWLHKDFPPSDLSRFRASMSCLVIRVPRSTSQCTKNGCEKLDLIPMTYG